MSDYDPKKPLRVWHDCTSKPEIRNHPPERVEFRGIVYRRADAVPEPLPEGAHSVDRTSVNYRAGYGDGMAAAARVYTNRDRYAEGYSDGYADKDGLRWDDPRITNPHAVPEGAVKNVKALRSEWLDALQRGSDGSVGESVMRTVVERLGAAIEADEAEPCPRCLGWPDDWEAKLQSAWDNGFRTRIDGLEEGADFEVNGVVYRAARDLTAAIEADRALLADAPSTGDRRMKVQRELRVYRVVTVEFESSAHITAEMQPVGHNYDDHAISVTLSRKSYQHSKLPKSGDRVNMTLEWDE